MTLKLSNIRVGRVTPCAPQFGKTRNGVTRPTFMRQRAFTMIEIAIALAVIAFALVAIIGVLPTGINVQKDNREDTIVNQDGPYWIEAIRNGSKGLDHLTNFVDSVTIHSISSTLDQEVIYTNSPGIGLPFNGTMTNGERIIGVLTFPKFTFDQTTGERITNTVAARARALTGSAVEQGKARPDFAFSYLLTAEVAPFSSVYVQPNSTNFAVLNCKTDPNWKVVATNWVQARSREINTSEIRLTFRWPLLANGQTGPNYQRFRVLATGAQTNIGGLPFIQPQVFTKVAMPICPP